MRIAEAYRKAPLLKNAVWFYAGAKTSYFNTTPQVTWAISSFIYDILTLRRCSDKVVGVVLATISDNGIPLRGSPALHERATAEIRDASRATSRAELSVYLRLPFGT